MQLVSRTIAVAAVLLFLASPSTLYATYTSTVSGSTATMTGDSASDTLTITQISGLLSFNRSSSRRSKQSTPVGR